MPTTFSTVRSWAMDKTSLTFKDVDELRTLPFPKLVVSGAHHNAFDAICDALERDLDAERVVLPGAGHAVQRAPGFNEALAGFLERAAR